MKSRKNLLSIAALSVLFLVAGTRPAAAAPLFFSIGGESVIKVADLPADFKNAQGTHFDLGYVYKQFSLFFCPVMTYEGRWCGYTGKSDEYIPFSDEKIIRDEAKKAGVTWPAEPKMGFWTAWGGKIVLLGVVAFVFIQKRGAKASAPPADSAAPPPPQA